MEAFDVITASGNGTPIDAPQAGSPEVLWNKHREINVALLSELREDRNSEWLLKHTREEAALGRMSEPIVLDESVLEGWLLQPRFAIEQRRADGSKKFRAVDNFSWCLAQGGVLGGVNGCTTPCEKLSHDTLDALADAMRLFVEVVQELPGLFKADIDSAYRRVPLKAMHRWACGIAFRVKEKVRSVVLSFSICKIAFVHTGVRFPALCVPIRLGGCCTRMG